MRPPERMGSGHHDYTPRLVIGGYYSDVPLVWGERCDQKRHFDCVGLINWLLSIAIGRSFVSSIKQYPETAAGYGWKLVTRSFSSNQHIALPGDIACLGDEHIGFIVGPGEMVESMDARNGVVLSRVPDRIQGWILLHRD